MTNAVTLQALTPETKSSLDFVQALASEVPSDLPYVRFHVAKLLVSVLFSRQGLSADQIARYFPEVDLRELSLEYASLLNGERLGAWFLDALDRYEPEEQGVLRQFEIDFSPSVIPARSARRS